MSQGAITPLAVGVVGDASPALLDGVTNPLSLTNDGRLRVASVDARVGVSFASPAEDRMWGARDDNGGLFNDGMKASYTFSGSPWGEW